MDTGDDQQAATRGEPSFVALPAGYEFPPVQFTVTEGQLNAYLEAVDHDGATPQTAPAPSTAQSERPPGVALHDRAAGRRVVPPIAVAAFALRGLVGDLALQPGAVHGGQEYEFCRPVLIGEPLVITSKVANRTRRRGTVILIVQQEVHSADALVMTGRAMLALPDTEGPGGS